ncbi:MAG: valine--tRNA ligase [Gammaproteobacteria bacterium]|nr:valine--tRNA ligase [Gammaproteobacteria bacterium]
MDKTYDPKSIEQHWYSIWERMNFFAPTGKGTPYCIMIPPPNVTGSLHMGHAFQNTLMDLLIRYHRMQGDKALWQVGTDHAGIATQVVVERLLEQEGTSRKVLGREAFVNRVWEWKEASGHRITEQLRRLGASVDWSRERFTMDETLSEAVQTVFIQLYEEGLIYRGQRLVNWDPILQSALSDLEVVTEETKGTLWHIRYPLTDNSSSLTVATTRPETLLGDAAVAVHPEDPRYQRFIGKTIALPLTSRIIPVIADESVERTFGSGCVKITPAHDFHDYEVAERHELPFFNIFTNDAKLNSTVPLRYQNLDRYVARKHILQDLAAAQLLEKTVEYITQIPKSVRTNAVIEPYLTEQWFVRVQGLAEPAIAAVEKGLIRFVPEHWTKTYFDWMHNIKDWCISRQLWWGHRIPAWYDSENKIYVGKSEEEIRQKYQLPTTAPLKQDEDVLDTWFSSALWPFSTLGWPKATEDMKTFYPTHVLVTGFDIIFFWVARMIMMGLKFTGQVPFKEVYIHGLVRDHEGHKMSKSKGNVLDPIDLIDGIDCEALVIKNTAHLMRPQDAEKIASRTRQQFPNGLPAFGADALRFAFCALAATGRDIRFDLSRIEGYRNFCNKLWNATRYVLMHQSDSQEENPSHVVNRWIQSRLGETIHQIRSAFETYRFDWAADALYHFIWHEYCDWYIEFAKQLPNETQKTLLETLEALLRLAHPFIPFVTEALWQQVAPKIGKKGATILFEPYPEIQDFPVDKKALSEIAWLQSVITTVRTLRSEMNVSPARTVPILFRFGTVSDKEQFKIFSAWIQTMAKIENISWVEANAEVPPAASHLLGELEVLMPLAGLVDKTKEIARLEKNMVKHQKTVEAAQKKLSDSHFRAHAPPDIVRQEEEKLSSAQSTLASYRQHLAALKKL